LFDVPLTEYVKLRGYTQNASAFDGLASRRPMPQLEKHLSVWQR
jgi:hypothetical protein